MKTMSQTENLRSLTIKVEGINSYAEAKMWLAGQSETVARVTSVSGNGDLVQTPWVEEGAFVDPTAQLIGGIIVKRGCYIGPMAVVRIDEKQTPEPLFIDECSNIQDAGIVHSTTQHIGKRVIVAHQAIVHGARVEDDVTIYIQAVVDGGGTILGKGCFMHQGSYVGKGIIVPENRYIAPGAKVLSQAEADALPPVPDELKSLSNHVLEHNKLHTARYLGV